MTDYYKVLGIPCDASTGDIKRAYRQLVLKHHPDHNSNAGAAEQFILIHEAYTILSDPDTRLRYNQSLADALKPKDYSAPAASADIKEQQQQARKEGEMYAQDYELYRKRLKKRIRNEMLGGLLGAIFRYGGGMARIFGFLLIAGGIFGIVMSLVYAESSREALGGCIGGLLAILGGIAYTRGVLKDIREEMEEEEREQYRRRTY